MDNNTKAQILYMYTCENIPVTTTSRSGSCIINELGFDNTDAKMIYEYLRSVGVATSNRNDNNYHGGSDKGCFMDDNITESDMMDFVKYTNKAKNPNIHKYFAGQREKEIKRNTKVKHNEPKEVYTDSEGSSLGDELFEVGMTIICAIVAYKVDITWVRTIAGIIAVMGAVGCYLRWTGKIGKKRR